MGELLTDAEREFIGELGKLWGKFCEIVGRGVTRDADCGEAVLHIHALQQAVMSQAAGRAYPDEFRLLGGTLSATPTLVRREWGGAWPGGTLGCSFCGLTLPVATEADADAAWQRLAEHRCTPAGEAAKVPIAEAIARRAAEESDEVTPEQAAEWAAREAQRGEPITPSYTEAEWVEVLERWLAAQRTTLIGRARPTTSPEERRVAAAELARWIIEAAGEILE